MTKLLIEVGERVARAALLDGDGRLDAFLVEERERPPLLGSLWLGRVRRVEAAQNAAFVALDDVDGYLNANDIPDHGSRPIGKLLQEGQALPVRVLRDATPGKGPKLTAKLDAAERELAVAPGLRAPVRLRGGESVLHRALRDLGPQAETIVVTPPGALAEAQGFMAHSLPKLATKLAPVKALATPFRDEGVEEQIDELLSPDVTLANGAVLRFGATPALTAIDVDRAASKAGAAEINRAAAHEIARQIRLRNIGGLVAIDFLRRPGLDRTVARVLREAFAGDRAAVKVLDISPLGLVELARQSSGPPLRIGR
jgi:Ribonuclease G/E